MASVDVTIDEFIVNGVGILPTTPVNYSYTSSTYPKTNTYGVATYPSVYPTDYYLSQNVSTVYTVGSISPIAFPSILMTQITASNISNIFIYAAERTFPRLLTSTPYFNFVVHKPEDESVYVSATITYTPNVGSPTTETHIFNFTGAVSSYTIDSVEVVPVVGMTSNDFVSVEKAVMLTDLPAEVVTITEFEECACELCDNCFTLTNCETGDTLTVKTDLVEEIGSVVVLEGYDGCWTVKLCDTIIEVVLTDSFVSCKSCLPNCNKPTC